MAFNGSNVGEIMEASANGSRVRFTRNVGTVTMDLNDVESIVAESFGGAGEAVTSATAVGTRWLKAHARTVGGKTVLKVGGTKQTLPRADLARIARAA